MPSPAIDPAVGSSSSPRKRLAVPARLGSAVPEALRRALVAAVLGSLLGCGSAAKRSERGNLQAPAGLPETAAAPETERPRAPGLGVVDPVPEPTEVRNKTQSVAVSSARAAVPDSSASEAEQQIEALQARVEELERLLARYQGGAAASGKSGAPSAGAAGPVRGARLEVVTPAPSDFRGTPVFLGKDGAQAASDPQRGFSRDEATRAFREAMVLLEAAQPSDAAVAFAEFLARHGDHALAGDAQHALADAYLKQKEFKLAETELKKLIVAYPKSHRVPFALRKLGRVLDTLGKKEEARKQRHLLLTLYPQSPAAAGARIALEEPETLPNAPSEPQLADGAPRTAASDWDEPPPTAPQAGPERSSLPATENDTGGSL